MRLDDLQLHIGEGLAPFEDRCGRRLHQQAVLVETGQHADAHDRRRPPADCRGRPRDGLQRIEDRRIDGANSAAKRREMDALRRAVEQLAPEVLFQRADLHADGRLNHIELRRGARDAAFVADAQEVAELTGFRQSIVQSTG